MSFILKKFREKDVYKSNEEKKNIREKTIRNSSRRRSDTFIKLMVLLNL